MARKTSNYIDDGYTEQGYLAEAPLVHTAVRFEYRPALAHERAELHSRKMLMETEPQKRFAKYAREIETRISRWDIVDTLGQPLPINATKAIRLKPELLEKLVNVISGVMPSDVDPEWADELVVEKACNEVDALLRGEPVGAVAEAANEKN